MEEVIKAVSTIFSKNRVKYVIIGGIAVLAWGEPRTTFDVDIVIALFPARLEMVISDFIRYGFTIRKDAVKRLRRGLATKLKHGIYSVDLRLSSFTLDKQAVRRARYIKVAGVRIPIASKEDLIVYKVAGFNYQDKADIEGILHRQRRIDFDYITNSARQLVIETQKPAILDNLSEILNWR